jgi:hypothetical protein
VSGWDAAVAALGDPWDRALAELTGDASAYLPPEWAELRRAYEAHQDRTQAKYGRHAPQLALLAREIGGLR